MRKLIALLSIATLAAVSCKKNRTETNTSDSSSFPKTSAADALPDVGQMHNTVFYADTASFSKDDDFYTISKRVVTTMNTKYGYSVHADSAAYYMTSVLSTNGYINSTGMFKSADTILSLAVQRESYAPLRAVYQKIIDSLGKGPNYTSWVKSQLETVETEDEDINNRKWGFGEVYIMSDVLVMGKVMPNSVSAADAMGYNDGYWYAQVTGGGRPVDLHGLHPYTYWALAFSIAYSEAVACRSMNSVP